MCCSRMPAWRLMFLRAWPMPTGATVCPSARWCAFVASQAFEAMLLVWSEDISVVFGSALLRIFFSGIALVNQYCLAFSFLQYWVQCSHICFFLPKFGFPIRLPYASHTPPIRLPYTSHTPPIRLPYTSHTPPIRLPYASHTPPIHLPYASHTPPIHLPYASHTPPIRLPYTSHTPPIHLPYTSHTPPIHLPYTSHTPPARSKYCFFSTFLPILEPRKPKILGFSWFAQTSYFGAENLPPNHGGGIFFEVDDPP